MTRCSNSGFTSRPGAAEAWITGPGAAPHPPQAERRFTARLTIDVTPDQRGRIKVAAYQRGQTVADMLRQMLAEAFPPDDGIAS